jgi:hypothetical protein
MLFFRVPGAHFSHPYPFQGCNGSVQNAQFMIYIEANNVLGLQGWISLPLKPTGRPSCASSIPSSLQNPYADPIHFTPSKYV